MVEEVAGFYEENPKLKQTNKTFNTHIIENHSGQSRVCGHGSSCH